MALADVSVDLFPERLGKEMEDQSLGCDVLAKRSSIPEAEIQKYLDGAERPRPRAVIKIAQALRVPRGWLVRPEPFYIASRKVALGGEFEAEFERELKRIAYDVTLLLDEGIVRGVEVAEFGELRQSHDPEIVATRVREHLGLANRPVTDVSAACDEFGLLVFVGTFDNAPFAGSMVQIEPVIGRNRLGIALINDSLKVGEETKSRLSGLANTRFAAAHELGHWLTGDGYSAHSSASEEERLIDLFAQHFLLPRGFANRRWNELGHECRPRARAIAISAESGTSWSVTLRQLRFFDLITDEELANLKFETPTSEEFADLGYDGAAFAPLSRTPARFNEAVEKAYREGNLTDTRANDLLRSDRAGTEPPERFGVG